MSGFDDDTLDPFLATWSRMDGDALSQTWAAGQVLGAEDVPTEACPALPRLAVEGDTDEEPEYRLGDILGSGGSAVVYAAEHRTLDRTVAIKALRSAINGDVAVSALLTEARIAGGLQHPNIVPVYALGLDGQGRPLMVMRRIEGEPWSALARDPKHRLWARWPGDRLDRALRVTLRVADALTSAHAAGVLHRDVKPSNVVVGPLGEVYLVDWGLGIRLGADGTVKPPLGGTPAYMAPEMFDPDRRLDVRADVYLLGATLFEAVVGRPARPARDLESLARAAFEAPPPVPDSVPDELAGIIQRAMAPSPDDRYVDVEGMRQALVDFLEHRSALELVAEAEVIRAQVDALVDDTSAASPVRRLTAEAWFGYRAALAAWPECPSAQRGLETLLEGAIRRDVAQDAVSSARSALLALPSPRPDLEALVEDAEARLADERAELDEARSMRIALDVRAGWSRRRVMLGVLLVLSILGPVNMGIQRLIGGVGVDEIKPTRGIILIALAIAWALYERRGAIDEAGALFNHRLARLTQVTLVGVGINWFVAVYRVTPVAELIVQNLLMISVSLGVAAVTLHRQFFIPTVIGLIGAGAAIAMPQSAELMLGLSFSASIIVTELVSN